MRDASDLFVSRARRSAGPGLSGRRRCRPGASGDLAPGVEDRTEQQQLRAPESCRRVSIWRTSGVGRIGCAEQHGGGASSTTEGEGARDFTDIRSKRSSSGATKARAMRNATSRMMIASARRSKSGRQARGEHRAILCADHAADEQQPGEHDVDRVRRHGRGQSASPR